MQTAAGQRAGRSLQSSGGVAPAAQTRALSRHTPVIAAIGCARRAARPGASETVAAARKRTASGCQRRASVAQVLRQRCAARGRSQLAHRCPDRTQKGTAQANKKGEGTAGKYVYNMYEVTKFIGHDRPLFKDITLSFYEGCVSPPMPLVPLTALQRQDWHHRRQR